MGIEPNREAFRIVLTPGLWRGVEVVVEPPTTGYPLRQFRAHGEALAHAEALARIEGWPITDRTGGAS